MTEELRKVLVALNQELDAEKKRPNSKADCTRRVISPEALFLVIWKVVPRFRGYQQQVGLCQNPSELITSYFDAVLCLLINCDSIHCYDFALELLPGHT